MSERTDKSEEAFQELVRVLERAVQAGINSIGLEYEGQDLMVIYYRGNAGLAITHIPEELRQAVIEEIVKRSGMDRKSRGKMQVNLLGKDYEVTVDEHEDFGESAFNLTLKEKNKRSEGLRQIATEKLTRKTMADLSTPQSLAPAPPSNPEGKQKVGRNDPCPCGSGKKYKACCLNKQRGF